MIITCERCETEFQLDDARVPVTGARVRCSRCKHAFFVLPPTATRDQAIEHAASSALVDDPTPDVTEDLPDTSAVDPERGVASERAGGEDSESDWQFNAELPADPGDSSPNLPIPGFARVAEESDDRLGAPDPEDETDSEADEPGVSLALDSDRDQPLPPPAVREERRVPAPEPAEDLGNPVNWDFFDEPADRPAPASAQAPQRASAPTLTIALDDEPASGPARGMPLALRRAVDVAGWIAVGALCAFALVRGLAPAAPIETVWPDPAPGLALEEVRGRWLDNASVGRLYVVSGRVSNRSQEAAVMPPLALELRDASGRALTQIPLRGAGPAELLRDASADAFATAGSDLPGGLAPGVGWDFAVVAWPLPAEAARFAIRARS